jgi:hypothetical protein
MKRRRVAILAFADSESSPLPSLTREADRIQEILHSVEPNTDIHPVVYPRMSLDGIAAVLRQQNWQVEIFHFAGHASEESLHLADLRVAFSRFGRILTENHKTKLVFLNGCGTETMVEELVRAGIPAVIATKTKVTDDRASQFAIRYYEALKENFTVEDAFWYAMDLVAAASRPGLAVIRGEVRHLGGGSSKDENAWVLHLEGGGKRGGGWRLRGGKMQRIIFRSILFTITIALAITVVIWQIAMNMIVTEAITVKVRPFASRNFGDADILDGYYLKVESEEAVDSIPLLDWEQQILINYYRGERENIRLYISRDGIPYSDPKFNLKVDTTTYQLLTTALILVLDVDSELMQSGLPDTLELFGTEPTYDGKSNRFSQQISAPTFSSMAKEDRIFIKLFVRHEVFERNVHFIDFETHKDDELLLRFCQYAVPSKEYPLPADSVSGYLTFKDSINPK